MTSPNADYVRQLHALLGNGRLRQMLTLASRIGASSGTIDPYSHLDRKELREWYDSVVAALDAAQIDSSQEGR